MFRYYCCLVLSLATAFTWADELPTSPAQQYLSSGEFAAGETALYLQLDAKPDDDEARFGLGAIQFLRAIEKLGQTLYEYGVVAERLSEPFPRLPVPKNDRPATISYPELRRILEVFTADLARAEATLAQVSSKDVKLKLKLAQIAFDFTGTGKQRITLSEILNRTNGGRPLFQQANQDIRIHFDRGDAAWLRAYCHLLAATADATLALDLSAGFDRWMGEVFPKRELLGDKPADPQRFDWITIHDAPRLRSFRLHMVAVCELNRETWTHIRQETDDDYEWLSHPKQKDQLGLPISDEQIDAWLKAMEQVEGLFTGQRLMPSAFVRIVDGSFPESQGLNLKRVFDDPPRDIFNMERIKKDGIDPKYSEPQAGKPALDINALIQVGRLYNGPFGFARAARMN